jgi:predicted SprT family Zn-dependent metalloprotease
MNLHLAQHLARTLMKEHGLDERGWTFSFDHARRRFGSCNLTRKRITLSRPLAFLNTEEQVRDTLLHEIAHALTPGDGHGRRWKAMCARIGARPQRCYRENEVIAPPRPAAPYLLGCPACGWWVERRRRPTRRLLCRYCRDKVICCANETHPPVRQEVA